MKILGYIIAGIVGGLVVIFLSPSQNLLGAGFQSLTTNTIQSVSTTPGGIDGNVQFNHLGTFGGGNNLTWLSATSRLGINTTTPGASLTVDAGSIYVASSTQGFVQRLTATTCMLAIPNVAGTFTTSSISCP